ncbi:MAG: GNAT family N-acetyltransferase [Tepidiformaceae bacterium]
MAADTIAPIESPGTASVRLLDWDTRFFGARMGVIDLGAEASPASLASELEQAAARARRDAFEHVIFRCDGERWESAWAAAEAGLRLVDVGVDLECRDLALRVMVSGGRCRAWQPDDLPALRKIAAESFVFSRFAVDPFFSRAQVEAFHAEWVTNLCAGLADAVLVAGEVGSPVGFVSCSMAGDRGRIPLIAVSADARGRGVGDQLMAAARAWFAGNGAVEAWVKTQAQNYPALRLYARHGFLPGRSEFVFSIDLRGPEGVAGGRS